MCLCFLGGHIGPPLRLCVVVPEFYPSACGTSPKTGEELDGYSRGGGVKMTHVPRSSLNVLRYTLNSFLALLTHFLFCFTIFYNTF